MERAAPAAPLQSPPGFKKLSTPLYTMRKVWYHQIWIQNYLGFIVSDLIYTATMVIGKRHERNCVFFDIELRLVLILLCYLLLIVHKKNCFSRNIYVKGLLFNISQGWIISISTYFCRYCIKPHNLVPFCIFLEHFSYTIQCNLDFNLLHEIIWFSDIIQFIDSFCRDQKCHKIEIALYYFKTNLRNLDDL